MKKKKERKDKMDIFVVEFLPLHERSSLEGSFDLSESLWLDLASRFAHNYAPYIYPITGRHFKPAQSLLYGVATALLELIGLVSLFF